jgi:hypothetical protein
MHTVQECLHVELLPGEIITRLLVSLSIQLKPPESYLGYHHINDENSNCKKLQLTQRNEILVQAAR